MSTFKNVAVAGATGNLGPAIVKALVDAGFQVIALSRSGKTEGLPSRVKTVKVDYDSKDSITKALKENNIDAFVSNVPNHDSQPALIDAAIAAGVKRFLPSDFGSNVSGNALTAKLPVFAGKLLTHEYLKRKESEIEWTIIANGVFLDWGLEKGFLINKHGGPTQLFDDPNNKFSATTLADVGKAVAGVLKHPAETKNRSVFVQSTSISQNELLAIAKKVKPELKIETENVSTAEVLKNSYGLLEKGEEIMGAMFGFLKVSIFGREYGSDLSGENDNELLGIKELTPKELEEVVRENL
ncbi:hypothetical protein PRZ48_013501 [Zasmidium cellare]|uniref:NmrA-like domain-containing protein n=1 Tax=Zasmidium cellare TaxID=395010 RepID=A0ABR0E181_ZASCE|nr:hypothetical protein PRZ48_013501 [Zasmidium cellare]